MNYFVQKFVTERMYHKPWKEDFTTLTFNPSTCIDDDGYIWVGVAYHLGQVSLQTLHHPEVVVWIVDWRIGSKVVCPVKKTTGLQYKHITISIL